MKYEKLVAEEEELSPLEAAIKRRLVKTESTLCVL
jgi:hypothetical protein